LGRRIKQEDLVKRRLQAAVASGSLTLALQPIVDSADGCLLGAEALAHWHDEELGTVPPSVFIPIAERYGLINKITSWVLHQALDEAVAWQRRGLDLGVAVNISAIDLHQPELVADIQLALTSSGCEPARLTIELTESVHADDPHLALHQLQAIKKLGVSLSLDDFGTGYSSLGYLLSFPIDTLKIDQSFVLGTPHNAESVVIVRAIIALARALGKSTVAEGIETKTQAEFLRDLGVDKFQGYFYSLPLSPEQFMALALSAGNVSRP
jgi:EAL domain-containing protein (putative c-di-GMP-specific phosphodiesterase class I)